MTNILVYAPNASTSGVTNAVYTLHKDMDKTKIRISVVTWPDNEKLCKLAQDFGGEVYPFHLFYWRNPRLYKKKFKEILYSQEFDVVVFHISYVTSLYPFILASKCNIKKIIVHSHSSNVETASKIKRLFLTSIHYLLRGELKKYSTLQLCCSGKSGEWMYGHSATPLIINNAIELNDYKFNPETREKLRILYGVENAVVIGHVGRLSYAKNQKYLIEIFAEILNQVPNARLWIIGDGPLREELEKKINSLCLSSEIKLWGNRNDVKALLNCMDCFVLPSKFEGAPVAAIEAQANGLPCVISSNVDMGCIITSNAVCEHIGSGKQKWANVIIKQSKIGRRDENITEIEAKGWELKDAKTQLEKAYIN